MSPFAEVGENISERRRTDYLPLLAIQLNVHEFPPLAAISLATCRSDPSMSPLTRRETPLTG